MGVLYTELFNPEGLVQCVIHTHTAFSQVHWIQVINQLISVCWSPYTHKYRREYDAEQDLNEYKALDTESPPSSLIL